ncbi:MAG: 50S ribosomal protein L10 [Syntrophomonadaceae bacterium]|jgi:large subunit ribosomal protein L10|nr:50S ribosomal protein L10 [Syntrophomonadaceae bacterium]
MPNIEPKKETVKHIAQKIADAQLIVFTDYRGLTVDEMSELRNALRTPGVEYHVMKNTMVEFALRSHEMEEVIPYINGPNAVLFSQDDLVGPVKAIYDFIKKIKKLEVKAGILDRKLISADKIKVLSELPSREVLIATVLGTMQAPITSLVYVLNANLTGLARALEQIRLQKEAG